MTPEIGTSLGDDNGGRVWERIVQGMKRASLDPIEPENYTPEMKEMDALIREDMERQKTSRVK